MDAGRVARTAHPGGFILKTKAKDVALEAVLADARTAEAPSAPAERASAQGAGRGGGGPRLRPVNTERAETRDAVGAAHASGRSTRSARRREARRIKKTGLHASLQRST